MTSSKKPTPVVQHLVAEALLEQLVPIGELLPYSHNPRRGNVDVIAESLAVNGQYRAIVFNRRTNEVLAGNHTLRAAAQLGWTHVAASWVDLDDEAAARIVLIDNKANDLAGYDEGALVSLLGELPDLAGTGYTDAELAALLDDGEDPVALTANDDAPVLPAKPISKAGDVWLLGPHRVFCGDSTDVGAVAEFLDGRVPDAVWTDPPYGVSYVGGTKDQLTIENDGAAGLPDLVSGFMRTIATVCKAGAPVYIAHPDTARMIFETGMIDAGLLVRQQLVWVKSSLVLGRSDYHWRHEPILEGAVAEDLDDASPVTHDGILYGFTDGGAGRLGRGGPAWQGDNKQSTVFEVPKPKRNGEHPTMKPTELIGRMLANSLAKGGLVLDLFGGSGSTLIAAHHGRQLAALVELDPRYVDVICRRWQQHTGIVPVLESTGEPIDFAEAA